MKKTLISKKNHKNLFGASMILNNILNFLSFYIFNFQQKNSEQTPEVFMIK